MGGSVRFMVTGSAPAPVRLLEFFHELGLPLYEAYGMSENVVPVAMNRPDGYRIGSVGRPLPQNEIRVADDGELLVRGPGLFAGYYRDSGSSELFTANGYYHTGDYAEIDADGFVALKGRKSEIIKTSAGRRISPVGIEAKLEEVPEVDRAVVFGAGRKCLSALLTLSGVHPVPVDSPSCGTPCELESLRRIVNVSVAAVRLLPEAERPAGFLLLRRPLSIERGEITPNLKLRRAVIEAVFRAQLDALYERIGFETASPIIIVAKDNDE
jgi:long-chain acyl-CoA synthetase